MPGSVLANAAARRPTPGRPVLPGRTEPLSATCPIADIALANRHEPTPPPTGVRHHTSMSVAAPIWASLITTGAAVTVATVTFYTQRFLALLRIRVDMEIKFLDTDLKHLETLLDSFIKAADAANRYVMEAPDIDISNWGARKPYVFPIVDHLGRARAELQAVGEFNDRASAEAALQSLEKLTSAHNDDWKQLKKAWSPDLLGEAIHAVSRARLARVEVAGRNWQKKSRKRLRSMVGDSSRREINH